MTTSQYHDHDLDSLFGSPPSTPRGRSPSLALPDASDTAYENVGTLALPGLHTSSELPINPSALPGRVPVLPPPRGLPCRDVVLQGAHIRPIVHAQKKTQTKAKAKSKSTTPRPEAPPIVLPDPNEPPPPNFLRNQQALLGLAGLIGGINPAKLPAGAHTRAARRGSTALDPILVEGDEEVPAPTTPHLTGDEIANAVLCNRDILPLLQSLTRLVNATESAQSQPFQRQPRDNTSSSSYATASEPASQPPSKRRRLNSVPAGAEDWDKRYPFRVGEGPPGYAETWKTERGKQLVGQLITAMSETVRTAAARKRERYQRSQESATPGKSWKASSLLRIGSNTSHQTSTSPAPTIPSTPSLPPNPATDFDSFFATLFSDSSQSGELQTISDSNTVSSELYSFDPSPSPATMTTSPTLSSTTRLSTPGLFNDFNKENNLPDTQSSDATSTAGKSSRPDIADSCIDPVLLEWSGTVANPMQLFAFGDSAMDDVDSRSLEEPAVVESDGLSQLADSVHALAVNTNNLGTIPSTSSQSSLASSVSIPSAPLLLQQSRTVQQNNTFTAADSSFNASFQPPATVQPSSLFINAPTPARPLPKPTNARSQRITTYANPPSTRFTSASVSTPRTASRTPAPASVPFSGPVPPSISDIMLRTGRSAAPRTPARSRAEILAIAHAKRDALDAEIARARNELWETAMEEAVLTRLSKDPALKI